jgi:hypothetical protein
MATRRVSAARLYSEERAANWKQLVVTLPMSSTLQVAEDLTDTCFQMYNRTATRLAPEISHFVTRPKRHDVPEYARRPHEMDEQTDEVHRASGGANVGGDGAGIGLGAARTPRPMGLVGGNGMDGDFIMKSNDAHNLLRPETVSVRCRCSARLFCHRQRASELRSEALSLWVRLAMVCVSGTSRRD